MSTERGPNRGGVGHAWVGWVMQGWGGSCRCGVGHTGMGWVMKGWGGSCRGGVGWVMLGGWGGAGLVMQRWVGVGGSCRGGVRWVIQRWDGVGHKKY